MNSNLYTPKDLKVFSDKLVSQNVSNVTIKNYLTDVKQFLKWREKIQINSVADGSLIAKFIEDSSSKFQGSSLKRKASAIRKYLALEENQNLGVPIVVYNYNFPVVALAILLVVLLSAFFVTTDKKINASTLNDAPVSLSGVSNTNTKASYSFDKTRGITIVLPQTPSEMANAEVTAVDLIDAEVLVTQGVARINKGKTKTLIVNNLVNEDSFIYLTPKSKTGNQILFIEEQAEGYAVIAVEQAVAHDLEFQWKVDNSQMYHDIL